MTPQLWPAIENACVAQGDCPAGKPRGRDAAGVQDSEAAHLNSPKRALESQISMSHLVPLLEFNLYDRTDDQLTLDEIEKISV
jgi:hypothetical protein